MTIDYDLFAETNPAFGAYALLGFVNRYIATSARRSVFALAYLALPIALSDDLNASFEETVSATGLLSWLNRYPDVRVGLGGRLDASKELVSAAMRFGLSAQALTLEPDGLIGPGLRTPAKAPTNNLPYKPKRALKRAERLGTWMGNAGSAGAIFSAFGVVP